LRVRDTSDVLATDHQSNLTGVTVDTDSSILFANFSNTCVLAPEGEVGPFWVKGEYIRDDLTEDEPGVDLYLDAQFIDVSTCEPITDLYWDVWSANSTGVYSGVVAQNNGNSADTSNLDNTALRGIVETDEDGVAQVQTKVPGHYSGRTNHIHIIAHIGATVLANGTLTGGNIPHIGQLFFDQSLINEVEALSPYSTNTQSLTTNAEDRVFSDETADSVSDPVIEYVLLGDTIDDGIFGWVNFGVNVDASYTASYAAFYGSDGGVSS
jgi:protocatechuate 3,4-dioxygenase beta subunit